MGLIALGEGEGSGSTGCAADPGRGALHSLRQHRPEAAVRPPQAADRLGLEHGDRRAGAVALPAVGAEQAAVADPEGLGAAIYLGTIPSLVAYGSWAVALSRLPASRATNFLFCVPPVATLIGYVWLGEVPGVASIVGGLLALGGVFIVNLKR